MCSGAPNTKSRACVNRGPPQSAYARETRNSLVGSTRDRCPLAPKEQVVRTNHHVKKGRVQQCCKTDARTQQQTILIDNDAGPRVRRHAKTYLLRGRSTSALGRAGRESSTRRCALAAGRNDLTKGKRSEETAEDLSTLNVDFENKQNE